MRLNLSAATSMAQRPLRVLVVGAGPSGTAAADRLAAAGASTVLLEASGRVGGRTKSVELQSRPGVYCDVGGQWVGTKQGVLRSLCAELGLALRPQHSSGRRVLDLGGVVSTYAGLIPDAEFLVLVDAQATLFLLALLQLALTLLPRALGGDALARALDAVTVEQFAARVMWTRAGKALVTIVVQGLFGLEPAELSSLALCRYAIASGGLERMTESGPGSLQADTIVGGAAQVSERLARRAEGRGARVLLGHAVSSIVLGPSGAVTVACANGARFECDRVVVAVPPPVAHEISFSPPLDAPRSALMRSATIGGIIKSIAVYERPFWREQGFSGEVICDTNADPEFMPVFNCFDNCLDGGVASLVIFINGARAREFSARPAAERRLKVLAQLARWFGEAAREPIEYVEADWVVDPYTRGCPIASFNRALLTEFGIARQLGSQDEAWGPRLLWASTETATVSTGFIDGALRSGLRAADEALGVRPGEAASTPALAPVASEPLGDPLISGR